MNEENVNAKINFETGEIEIDNNDTIGVPEHDGGFGASSNDGGFNGSFNVLGGSEGISSDGGEHKGVFGTFETGGTPSEAGSSGEVGNFINNNESVGSNSGKINFSDPSKPAKIGIWTKFKNLFVSVENRPVSDSKFVNFWMQEVTFDKVYDFLFQEIKFK